MAPKTTYCQTGKIERQALSYQRRTGHALPRDSFCRNLTEQSLVFGGPVAELPRR